jgi:hypothetical protein
LIASDEWNYISKKLYILFNTLNNNKKLHYNRFFDQLILDYKFEYMNNMILDKHGNGNQVFIAHLIEVRKVRMLN